MMVMSYGNEAGIRPYSYKKGAKVWIRLGTQAFRYFAYTCLLWGDTGLGGGVMLVTVYTLRLPILRACKLVTILCG